MEFKSVIQVRIIFAVFLAATINSNAVRRVILRPLSAEEVVGILKLAGREDAIPEGRIVTQGLAAISGFVLGLTKGIGSALLFDLATSNATSQFINDFNSTAMMNDFQGINMTALWQMFNWDFANNNSSTIRYKTTEICFDTRGNDRNVEERAKDAAVSIDIGTDIGTNNNSFIRSRSLDVKTITRTSSDSSKTCIVLQMPIIRERRSSYRKRRR